MFCKGLTFCFTVVLLYGKARIELLAKDQRVAVLKDGRQVNSELMLFTAGRMGATDSLNLENCGLEADSRGRLKVNPQTNQTDVPHIYAAGDVIGFLVCVVMVRYGAHMAADSFRIGSLTIKNLVFAEWWLLAPLPERAVSYSPLILLAVIIAVIACAFLIVRAVYRRPVRRAPAWDSGRNAMVQVVSRSCANPGGRSSMPTRPTRHRRGRRAW